MSKIGISVKPNKLVFSMGWLLATILLGGCVAKNINFTEQQKEQQRRMQRCDQYIERDRELCLQGEHITIEDYKDDYKDFKKDKQKQEDAQKANEQVPSLPTPIIKKSKTEVEDKPH
jgi:hypothetical protein